MERSNCASAPKNVEEQFAGDHRSVDCLGERAEADLAGLLLVDRFDELLHRPDAPIELPDDAGLAGARQSRAVTNWGGFVTLPRRERSCSGPYRNLALR
jgi:hypothetical protein